MGEYLLSGISIALVALVFWAVKVMIAKQDEKVNKIKEELMTMKEHDLICGRMQAEFKLHVSEVAKENRDIMMIAISENKASLKKLIADLRVDLIDKGLGEKKK